MPDTAASSWRPSAPPRFLPLLARVSFPEAGRLETAQHNNKGQAAGGITDAERIVKERGPWISFRGYLRPPNLIGRLRSSAAIYLRNARK